MFDSSQGLSAGAIVGIAVASVLVFIGVLVVIVAVVGCSRGRATNNTSVAFTAAGQTLATGTGNPAYGDTSVNPQTTPQQPPQGYYLRPFSNQPQSIQTQMYLPARASPVTISVPPRAPTPVFTPVPSPAPTAAMPPQ